jgi:hypothetical protein
MCEHYLKHIHVCWHHAVAPHVLHDWLFQLSRLVETSTAYFHRSPVAQSLVAVNPLWARCLSSPTLDEVYG